MAVSTPRLYRKDSGVYFVRILATVEVGGTLVRREIRRSLHTKSPQRAHELSAALNAALACMPMAARAQALDKWSPALSHAARQEFSTPMAASVPQEFQSFPPQVEIARQTPPASTEQIHAAHDRQALGSPTARDHWHFASPTIPPAPASGPAGGPANRLLWHDATIRYASSLRADAAIKEKTLQERLKTLNQFHDFMVKQPGIGTAFGVHEVHKHHIGGFIDGWAQRPARSARGKPPTAADSTGLTVAPKSVLKCISNLILFFAWASQEAQATAVDPTEGLRRRTLALRSRLDQDESGYLPFNDEQLRTIFDPARYLSQCRDADHFWAPLLGAHLGVRLGEIVTLALDAVRQHEISGIWYLDIRPEAAKNRNSIRRLPITRPLMELGFIDYVEKLRRLGATGLFPHRNLDNPSAQRQPSKNTSEKFARYLDVCGVRNPRLVFHSFRHTAVTALQYAGTPLHVSQQIVGHMAQDYAVRTGQITQAQARSVTLRTYTHADIPSMRVDDPFLALKSALENAMTLPLDYPRLARAARIVLDHVTRTSTGFHSGWAAQNQTYTDRMLQLLD